MKPLDDFTRKAAEVTARVIAGLEALDSDAPEQAAPPYMIRLLARAHIELRDQIRALHDLVNHTDPNDPIKVALTKVGFVIRPSDRPAASEPRLVPTPEQLQAMTTEQLIELYCRVMGRSAIAFIKHTTFIVRHWDGMDGCWTDYTGQVSCDEALRAWVERTNGGARHISYTEIDYYAIFPGDTHMLWDGSEGMEMHR